MHAAAAGLELDHLLRVRDPVGGHDEHDLADPGDGDDVQGVLDEAVAADLDEGLGPVRPEAGAGPGGDDDDARTLEGAGVVRAVVGAQRGCLRRRGPRRA
ncbi:hypothetical protein GCM10027055_03210 [Janibacter alkaliphilus]